MGARVIAIIKVAYLIRRAVLLEGPTGIGKSEIIQQAARELGIDVKILDLSLLEPPDLLGLPFIQNGKTVYAAPKSLPTHGKGILLLEELNRASRYVQQPALQLLTARRLNDYVLPDGWVCCAAINPEDDAYQVNPLDPALRSRFLQVLVKAERSAWKEWAQKSGIHRIVLKLVNTYDHIFDELPPRTWTYVSEMLYQFPSEEMGNDTLIRDALGGYLDGPWLDVVHKELKNTGPDIGVDPYRLVKDYHKDKDMQSQVQDLLARGSTDHVNHLCNQVLDILCGPELDNLQEEKAFSLKAVEKLIQDVPGDTSEMLEEGLSNNPMAVRMIGISPEEILRAYGNSFAERKVKSWKNRRSRSLRLGILVTALCLHMKQIPGEELIRFRRDNNVRVNLGRFLKQIQPFPCAGRLADTMKKLGIIPCIPGGSKP